jgi:hypothetical protein
MDWIIPAQDRDQRRALVNTVSTFGFHKMLGNSWKAGRLPNSQEGFRSMESDVGKGE